METSFYRQIARSTAHRPIRDVLCNAVLQDESLLDELIKIALTATDPNHHKACWILELVLQENRNGLLIISTIFAPFFHK